MNKATVTRFFIGGMLAVLSGAVLGVIALAAAIANDVFVLSGTDIVGIHGSVLAWSLLGLGITAAVAMLAGMIAGVVAWIGALLNTAHLEGKGWFVGLLLLGIFSLGFVAMIVYVVAGPDGTRHAGGSPASVRTAATAA